MVFEVKADELPLGEYFGRKISDNMRSASTGNGCDFFIEDRYIWLAQMFYE